MYKHKISVVLPTYNRLDRLKKVLSGLELQDYGLSEFEVIVVSDGSQDGTNGYLETIKTPLNLTPLLQENHGVAVARNNGFKQAKGEYVLFIDDDVYPTANLITEHLKMHEAHAKEDVIVIGPMLTPSDFDMAPWVQWEQAMLVKQYDSMINKVWEATARQFYTGNTSLKQKFLVKSGGFDPSFRRAEDVELAYRLSDMGLKFVFHMDAVGYHYADRSFSSWMNIPYAYGRNDVIFTYQKGQDWLLPSILEEYGDRHPFVHLLTRIGIDRPLIGTAATYSLKYLASIFNLIGLSKGTKSAYSGIFNLRYFQGVADELGGRQKFFHLAQKAQQPDPQ